MPNSFLDLDYIIEINEKRVEQYIAGNDKILGRLPTIIIIYSALTIFLVPIIQDWIFEAITHWLFYTSLFVFAIIFGYSIYFTIKLIIPKELINLVNPRRYYSDYRLQYQQTNQQINDDDLRKLLNASYITELEEAIDTNQAVFESNGSFYYRAVLYGLLSTIPYIICLGFHVVQKDDKIQKVQLVNGIKDSSLHKMSSAMPKDSIIYKDSSRNVDLDSTAQKGNGQVTIRVTKDGRVSDVRTSLPGVNNSQVIVSPGRRVKQNSDRPSNSK